MALETNKQREQLLTALRDAWNAEAELVKRFGLVWDEGHVEQSHGGWIVPVSSGVEGGSARELVRALDTIEDRLEQSTSLDVSVLLEPGLNGTTEN